MIARVYGRWMPTQDITAGEKAELTFNPALYNQPIEFPKKA
jgi:hypothetical protein